MTNKISNEKYDVVIIGSGISGLCSAALLSMEGMKVLVLEKHFKIGGYTHTFKRSGFEWDVGIHYIGGVHNKNTFTRRLFDKISDSNLEWSKMSDNYDRMIFPDRSYDFIAPKEKFVEKMKFYFPNESVAIDKYMDLVKEVHKTSYKYFSAKALSGISEILLRKYLTKRFLKFSNMKTYEALSTLTSNQELIGVLSGQWGDYGMPPKESSFVMHCMIANHYFDGANYPVGGSRMISENILPVIQRYGGKVLKSTGVDKIYTENGECRGVILESGEQVESNIVISSAGVQNTLTKLLRDETQLSSYQENLKSVVPSSGHACLYIGFNKSAEELGISDTNLWVYPGYDHDSNVRSFRKNQDNEFAVLYMSFASAKDSMWDRNHPNTATMEVIVPSGFEHYRKWEKEPWKKRGGEYEDYKNSLSQRIVEKVYKHCPHLNNQISYHELSTPLSTKDLANYQYGELYGIDHNPERFRQKWLKPKTPIKNLYLTGQDILTVGLAGALASGVLTSSVVAGKNLFKKI
jgi:all-trans-retinol 13,14-reductase